MFPTGFDLFKKLYLHLFSSLYTSSSLSESLSRMLSTSRARVKFGMGTAHKNSISASLTRAILDAIVFISIRAKSSQQYARVPHAMAQFALKTAQIISWGLSLP
jgi:hypothetical protein